MKDVQCKKKGNQVIPVSEAVANFEDHNSCYSCQDFDKCREEAEQNEVEYKVTQKVAETPEEKPRYIIDYDEPKEA